MVTPLIRKSIDIGIFGNKSEGKSMVMNAFGLFFALMGFKVFSNHWVAYPHTIIDDFDGLTKISLYDQSIKKIVLMEDFERWVHSRNASQKMNIDINAICIDFGKNNASLVYTSKRPMAIDIGLRDTTDVFIETTLVPFVVCRTGNEKLDEFVNTLWSKDLEMNWVEIKAFDCNMRPFPMSYLKELKFFGGLYHTQEIVKEIT